MTTRTPRIRRTALLAGAAITLAAAAGTASGQSQPPPPEAVAPAPGVIAQGVRIDGVPVAGLTRADATKKILKARVAPKRRVLAVKFRGKRFAVKPVALGYSANVRYSVTAAMNFGRSRKVPVGGVDVPLRETLSRQRVRALVDARARAMDVPARSASISFRGAAPTITKARVGIAMRREAAATRLSSAILERRPRIVTLPAARVRPAVTTAPPAVLINRGTFTLTLFKGGKKRTFGVAVGKPGHSTPSGSFRVVDKQRNPTWYPPDSPWAAGIGPVSPGAGNPLGTRWMGISSPAIGIHGTPVPSSIGSRASHGCIRMRIPEAEYLFDQIEHGTPVVIV